MIVVCDLSPAIVNQYITAGKIICSVHESIPPLVKESMSFSEICERIESAIRRKGGEPAFPCNIGVNTVAAYYTASPDARARVSVKYPLLPIFLYLL